MAVGEALREDCTMKEEESGSVDFESSDDSDDDPSFDIVEETRSELSKISLKKPRMGRGGDVDAGTGGESEMDCIGDEIPKMNEEDEKCFEKVEKLVKGGDFEKLKLDQCKIYLRKYGLRLTGNKGILISRIREHQELIDGCGLKKYPPESFILNCKGDACVGDVVIFEQKVYEMFSVASRSATGPPCGSRTVAGRIVKESYGVAKQQHTFTIEVLWSKGLKPLPPLHQLLIKGRNLYRIKTMRQRWADEGERLKALQEKHTRGSQARYSREIRIQEKKNRKKGVMMTREIKIKEKENRTKGTMMTREIKIKEKENRTKGTMMKRQDANGNLNQTSKENMQPLKPQNGAQQKKSWNHEKLQQGEGVKLSTSMPGKGGGRENLAQLPLQGILEKTKAAEHSISSAQARHSCGNHHLPRGYASQAQNSWNPNHLNPRGNYANLHGFQQPSILGRPMLHFHHMNQYLWANHAMPIPPQQQYRSYRGETSSHYYRRQDR